MCAYNRFEGEPCCGSNRLLYNILREDGDLTGLLYLTVVQSVIFILKDIMKHTLLKNLPLLLP